MAKNRLPVRIRWKALGTGRCDRQAEASKSEGVNPKGVTQLVLIPNVLKSGDVATIRCAVLTKCFQFYNLQPNKRG
jgi:hypothetical protein